MNSILVSLWLLGGSCAGPDAESTRLAGAVTAWRAVGDSIFKAIDTAAIVLETDEAVCSRLIEAYSKLPGEVDTPGSLYVVRIGRTHYGIFDPNDMAGTSRTVMIFDSELRLRAVRHHAGGLGFSEPEAILDSTAVASSSRWPKNARKTECPTSS